MCGGLWHDERLFICVLLWLRRFCPGFGDGVKGYGIQFKPKDGAGPEVTHVSALARTHAEIEGERERERASERARERVGRLGSGGLVVLEYY